MSQLKPRKLNLCLYNCLGPIPSLICQWLEVMQKFNKVSNSWSGCALYVRLNDLADQADPLSAPPDTAQNAMLCPPAEHPGSGQIITLARQIRDDVLYATGCHA